MECRDRKHGCGPRDSAFKGNVNVPSRSDEFLQAMVIAALSASGCGHAAILPGSVNDGESVENSDRKCQNVVTNSTAVPH